MRHPGCRSRLLKGVASVVASLSCDRPVSPTLRRAARSRVHLKDCAPVLQRCVGHPHQSQSTWDTAIGQMLDSRLEIGVWNGSVNLRPEPTGGRRSRRTLDYLRQSRCELNQGVAAYLDERPNGTGVPRPVFPVHPAWSGSSTRPIAAPCHVVRKTSIAMPSVCILSIFAASIALFSDSFAT